MKDLKSPIFVSDEQRLPLVTDRGRTFWGLQNSSSPELSQRVKFLFEHLNEGLGFPDTVEGREHQHVFNTLLRSVYPEVAIDLADLVFVQHERPAVVLNFDHININLRRDKDRDYEPLGRLNETMSVLFFQLAQVLKKNLSWLNDPKLIRLLSESYSYYLFQTGNFPWDNPMEEVPSNLKRPLIDVATGLVGFSLIHDWPPHYPRLVLTDNMPFIIQGLNHYKNLMGKRNVDILNIDFPEGGPPDLKAGCILANKFLHHLQRQGRRQFLEWARESLQPGGTLRIRDTDLEYRILSQVENPEIRGKLIPGYLETLVAIEENFCKNLLDDIKAVGFKLRDFDFHEYLDETDAYSRDPGDNLSLKFVGFEIVAEKVRT